MSDSRCAQLTIQCAMIDNRPDLVIGSMQGMIVLQCGIVTIGRNRPYPAMHYIVWHGSLPNSEMVLGKPPPWIEADIRNAPTDTALYRYVWRIVGSKIPVIAGEFRVVAAVADPIIGAEAADVVGARARALGAADARGTVDGAKGSPDESEGDEASHGSPDGLGKRRTLQ